ncbi:hypothetical protein [Saccharopolyspora shandongensis]
MSTQQYDTAQRAEQVESLDRYAFSLPAGPSLRPLRDPHTEGEDDAGQG